MAAGKLILNKASGGVLNITPADGATSTDLVLPESGELVTKDYADLKVALTGNQTIAGVKTFSSTISGSISGNAATATKLATARKISGVSFDGTADITIPSIPTGGIIMWSGSIVSIPTGWALCDGANGTPDLRDRFVIGAGNTYNVGATGGSKDAVVVSHTHTGTAASGGSAGSFVNGYYNSGTSEPGFSISNKIPSYASISAHTHSLTINSTGSSGTNANLPPYYALAYIMKI